MVVVTCISDENHKGYNEALIKSCQFNKINIKTLIHSDEWDGFRIKDS